MNLATVGAASLLNFGVPVERTEDLSRDMRDVMTYPYSKAIGRPQYVYHCRKAPGGCEARLLALAGIFVAAGVIFGVDPWLLAAMAFRESGLNPWAKGEGGELGVLQLHPKRADTRRLRMFRSERYRERCQKAVDACQVDIVATGAAILRRAYEACGKRFRCALCMYNTGKAHDRCDYSERVLATYVVLKGEAKG